MKISGLSKFNRVLRVLPKSNSAGDTPVVAFGVVRYDKRNLISLVDRVPESPFAALMACLNV